MECNVNEVYSSTEIAFKSLWNDGNMPENMAQVCADQNQKSYYVDMSCSMIDGVAATCIFAIIEGINPKGRTYTPAK